MLTYIILALGLLALFVGGDLLVKGASGLALRFGLSPMVIGLTVVGFGTSTPELLVSLNAALGGQAGIAIGNVVGSNIANTLLILGVALCHAAARFVLVGRGYTGSACGLLVRQSGTDRRTGPRWGADRVLGRQPARWWPSR